MLHRAFAIIAVVCLALGGSGCASKSNKDYEEVLMPLQTGSTLQRRVLVRVSSDKKKATKKSDKKQKEKPKKPEAEPSATPAPEEESTPPPDRFR